MFTPDNRNSKNLKVDAAAKAHALVSTIYEPPPRTLEQVPEILSQLKIGDKIAVGRRSDFDSSLGCRFCVNVPDPKTSKVNCIIEKIGSNTYKVVDGDGQKKSTNGTFIGYTLVGEFGDYAAAGDIITIGETKVSLAVIAEPQSLQYQIDRFAKSKSNQATLSDKKIANLNIGESVFIGRSDLITSDPNKDKISSSHCKITKIGEQSYLLEDINKDGRKSTNGTFYKTSYGMWQEVVGKVLIRADQEIALAESITKIPKVDHIRVQNRVAEFKLVALDSTEQEKSSSSSISSVSQRQGKFIAEPLQQRISKLKANQKLEIGTFEGDGVAQVDAFSKSRISPKHCFIEKDHDGNYFITDGSIDGELSTSGTFVLVGEDLQKVEGRHKLSSGQRIFLGKEFSFCAPIFEREALQAKRDIEAEASRGLVGDRRYLDRPEIDRKYLKANFGQATILGGHIVRGLDLIKEKKFSEAIKHFANEEIASFAGFRYSEGNVIGVGDFEQTPEGYANLIHKINFAAMRSWFYPDHDNSFGGTISPSRAGNFSFSKQPRSEVESEMLNFLNQESALIAAEEWIHAYQNALGKNVSRAAELLVGVASDEEDVPQFMREQGVALSPLYMSRYNRKEVLDRLDGIEDSKEALSIAAKIAAMEINTKQVIGTGDSCDIVIRKCRPNLAEKSSEEYRAIKQKDKVSPTHLEITKISADLYQVKNLSAEPSFYKDQLGFWRKIAGVQELKAGSVVRLGPFYEISLGE